MNHGAVGITALRMYDLPEIREPLQELWSSIAARLESAPIGLSWDGDMVGQWLHPQLVLGQTCGWPLVTALRNRVTVVGAFRYDLPGSAEGSRYRSVLVATEKRPLASFGGGVAAINDWDSLSGRVSLSVAIAAHGSPGSFFAETIHTGSHLASIEAVRSGDADLASIDAVSHALFERHRPELTAGLVVVGHGPLVPTLPLITARADPAALRIAIETSLADPTTAPCRRQLLITGFDPVNFASYESLANLPQEESWSRRPTRQRPGSGEATGVSGAG